MSTQKINIVLFGPGKVGNALVGKILNNQSLLLEQKKDVRISLVISSSLVFIENEKNKNSWDVTFIKSSKSERIANVVSYIQDNDFEKTIVIDTTKQSEIPNYYSYFLQNGLDVISLNSDFNLLSQREKDEIKISSEVYDRKFFRLQTTSVSKEVASEIAFQNIFNFSENLTQSNLIKQAI